MSEYMRARRGERQRCNGGQEKGNVYTQKMHTCGQTAHIGEHEVENGTVSSFSSHPHKTRHFPCSLDYPATDARLRGIRWSGCGSVGSVAGFLAIRGSLSLGEDS